MRNWLVVLAAGTMVLAFSAAANAQGKQQRKGADQGQGVQQRLRDGSCQQCDGNCQKCDQQCAQGGNQQRLRLRDGSGCGQDPAYCPQGGQGGGRGFCGGMGAGGGRGMGMGMGRGMGRGMGGGMGMQHRRGQSN